MNGVGGLAGYLPELHKKLEIIASYDKLNFLIYRVEVTLGLNTAPISEADNLNQVRISLRNLSGALHYLEAKLTFQNGARFLDARVVHYLPAACRNLRYLNDQLIESQHDSLKLLHQTNTNVLDRIEYLAAVHLPLTKLESIPIFNTPEMMAFRDLNETS